MEKALLEKFIEGGCTPEEARQVSQWLLEHPDALDTILNNTWAEPVTALMPADMESSLRVSLPLQTTGTTAEAPVYQLPHNRSAGRYRWYAAAAVVLLLVGGWWMARSLNNADNSGTNALVTVTVPAGKMYKLTLPDESTVWLKGNTQLKYDAKQFGIITRHVELMSGEAFFDVQRNAEHPFVVEQGGVRTTVLGTSFSVKAATDKNAAVITVATGKISVSHHTKELEVLTQGRQLVVNAQTGHYTVSQVPVWMASAFKDSVVQLNAASFGELQQALQQFCNIQLQTNQQQVKQQRYTIQLNRSTPVKDLMDVLCLLNQNQYHRKNDSTYIIY
ncbi:hypothetical protein HHL16_16100 [Pseudoflavitalea sp. G-6-1-2]|uniref:FecR family protein n=1 Tax=Pseudoflavitalea sp. G-6-1-2 TaxID=2728841 RepID=UPI00146B1501|nr:FecR domain-containing protein [Pseudoflavitalea sp. G-6-1-2]NML22407.1 hypothetical protein [Pseudoflavitalea sp. G-6-1-2]